MNVSENMTVTVEGKNGSKVINTSEKKKDEVIWLKIPKRNPENNKPYTSEERNKMEQELYKAGALYNNYTISAKDSYDGKEHKGRNFFVYKNDKTDLSRFAKYMDKKDLDEMSKTENYTKNNGIYHFKVNVDISPKDKENDMNKKDYSLYSFLFNSNKQSQAKQNESQSNKSKTKNNRNER